ncbi:MAG: hypothetical protein Q4D02_05825 [Clostridia bacterium]|nr:hypothetical protein [Clostridia bacterium]
MQKFIILSLLYGILSTFLVHPWYLKGLLKGKTILKNFEDYYGFKDHIKIIYIELVFIMIGVAFIYFLNYFLNGNLLYPLMLSKILIVTVYIFQLLNLPILFDYLKDKSKIRFKKYFFSFTIIFIVVLSLNICNQKVVNQIDIPDITSFSQDKINIKHFIPSSEISFSSDNPSNVYVKGDANYFLINETDSSKIGIIYIHNPEKSTYISLKENLYFSIYKQRSTFPNQIVDSFGIAITEDNTVYKVYAISNFNGNFKKMTFSAFLFKNCESTETIIVD